MKLEKHLEEKIRKEITEAEKRGDTVGCCILHFGNSQSTRPAVSKEQCKFLAERLGATDFDFRTSPCP